MAELFTSWQCEKLEDGKSKTYKLTSIIRQYDKDVYKLDDISSAVNSASENNLIKILGLI